MSSAQVGMIAGIGQIVHFLLHLSTAIALVAIAATAVKRVSPKASSLLALVGVGEIAVACMVPTISFALGRFVPLEEYAGIQIVSSMILGVVSFALQVGLLIGIVDMTRTKREARES